MTKLRKVLSIAILAAALAMTFGASTTVNADGGTNDLAPVDVVEVNGLIDEIVVSDIEQAIVEFAGNYFASQFVGWGCFGDAHGRIIRQDY